MNTAVEELALVPDSSSRPDSLKILREQDESRIPELVPVRHERMSATAFTFYRGAAAVMTSDLALTANTGIHTQLCGDAHLSNFGIFRSPERRMVFDLNDFDETHPGPFEWDVKRLAASFVVAAQNNGFSDDAARRFAKATAKSYRKVMVESAAKPTLDCWYGRVDADDVITDIGDHLDTAASDKSRQALTKARHRDSASALSKLCYFDLAGAHIRSDPPLLVPAAEVLTSLSRDELHTRFNAGFAEYRGSLPAHIVTLFDQYELIEAARKVVGVGSVGTHCWIALFGGSGVHDPLFLQLKEASESVIAPYVPGYDYADHGQRVVQGQQLMQASSDIFLGWARTAIFGGPARDFYVRQLRDGKGSVVVEALGEAAMKYYARLCGTVLAQAHARTAARAQIADYVGSTGKAFDVAIAEFALAYSGINGEDYRRLVAGVADSSVSAAALA